MYENNIEPEMFLPPGSEGFYHNATRTTSRSRSNNVNNNIVPVYIGEVCKNWSLNCKREQLRMQFYLFILKNPHMSILNLNSLLVTRQMTLFH